MRADIALKLLFAAGLAALACLSCASNPAPTDEAQSRMLQTQVDNLSRELMLLKNTAPAGQTQAMQDYWAMLQRQLTQVRDLPGVEPHDCKDWMLVSPGMPAGAPARAIAPCPVIHDAGPVSGRELPASMKPDLFQLMMDQQLRRLSAQVTAIRTETDQHKRIDLLRAYYDTRYQDIQTVLGRGWMWAPPGSVVLPDADSLGAKLVANYCSQCHAAPPPGLHTQAEWAAITRRMRDIIQAQSRSQVMGIRLPNPDEIGMIASYLGAHAGDTR